jgi:hypothetical protein
MPDITMCMNDACPLGPRCRRNMLVTKPGYPQSWAMFERRPDGGCDNFLDISSVDTSPASAVALATLAVQRSAEGS